MLESLLLWLGESIVGDCWRWFFPKKDAYQEVLENDLKAKEQEAAALAAPARDKSAIVLSLREHEQNQ